MITPKHRSDIVQSQHRDFQNPWFLWTSKTDIDCPFNIAVTAPISYSYDTDHLTQSISGPSIDNQFYKSPCRHPSAIVTASIFKTKQRNGLLSACWYRHSDSDSYILWHPSTKQERITDIQFPIYTRTTIWRHRSFDTIQLTLIDISQDYYFETKLSLLWKDLWICQ